MQASSWLLSPFHQNSRCRQAQSVDNEASPSSNIKTHYHRLNSVLAASGLCTEFFVSLGELWSRRSGIIPIFRDIS
jgi:hypothetical protein